MTINLRTKQKGFSLIEVVVSVGILALILVLLGSFVVQINSSGVRSRASRHVQENAQRIIDQIVYEIRGAQSVYVPTTTLNQLSLQTLRYAPAGNEETFIDIFLCGTDICLKKEGQDPIALNSDTVSITNLTFSRVVNGSSESVKVGLTVSYKNAGADLDGVSATTLDSTVSLRSY